MRRVTHLALPRMPSDHPPAARLEQRRHRYHVDDHNARKALLRGQTLRQTPGPSPPVRPFAPSSPAPPPDDSAAGGGAGAGAAAVPADRLPPASDHEVRMEDGVVVASSATLGAHAPDVAVAEFYADLRCRPARRGILL